MHTTSPFALSCRALLAAALAAGSLVSAQQAPSSTPFGEAVKVSVVAAKPAKVKGGDWDDMAQKITLRVKFTNTDVRQSYEGYTATISAFGKSAVDSKVKKVLLQEQETLSLASGQTQEHVCQDVSTLFDKTGAKFGFFYDGWIIVVKDSADKVVLVKATSSTMEKLTDLAATLKLNGYYSPKLKPVGAPAGYGN